MSPIRPGPPSHNTVLNLSIIWVAKIGTGNCAPFYLYHHFRFADLCSGNTPREDMSLEDQMGIFQAWGISVQNRVFFFKNRNVFVCQRSLESLFPSVSVWFCLGLLFSD